MVHVLKCLMIFVAACYNFDLIEGAYKRRPTSSVPCEKLSIANAIIKYRRMNTIAKIRCKYGTIIMGGVRRLACIRGKWNGRIPQCISAGCEDIDFANGEALEMYDGALVHFTCDPGYKLQGSPALFCDGKSWNGSAPTCEIPPPAPDHSSCIFEDVSLCGWTQDHLDDFDWKWSTGALNALTGSYGAKVDATFGSSAGHYIFADSRDNWTSKKKARIFSPMLKRTNTQYECVTFKYHMNGPGTGHLNIYFKPQDIPFELMVADAQIKGYNCDEWTPFIQSLQTADIESEYFQVVLEAWGGDGFVSDIAVDDFKLKTGVSCFVDLMNDKHFKLDTTDCSREKQETTTRKFVPVSTCRHRCGLYNLATMTCDCHAKCISNNNCCDDYQEACGEKETSITGSSSTTLSTQSTNDQGTTEVSQTSTTNDSPTTRRKIYFLTTTPYTWPTLQSISTVSTLEQKTLTPTVTTMKIYSKSSTESSSTRRSTETSSQTPSSTSAKKTTIKDRLTTSESTTVFPTSPATSSTTVRIFSSPKTTRSTTRFTTTMPTKYFKTTRKPTTAYISSSSTEQPTVRSSDTSSQATTLITLALESPESKSHPILISILCVIVIFVLCGAVFVYLRRGKQKSLYEYSDINAPAHQNQRPSISVPENYVDVSYRDVQKNLESYVQLNNDCDDDPGTPV